MVSGGQGSESHNVKSRRSRAWSTKARTGCVTCKARKVKCDEGKPSCRQCTRVNRICGGYTTTRPRKGLVKTHVDRTSRELRPKIIGISIKPIVDDLEGVCFQYYLQNTAAALSGPFRSTFWARLVPQASINNPPVHHAVVSIAALSLVMHENDSRLLSDINVKPSGRAEKYHQFGLQQYSKALTQLISLSENEADTRTRLIAGILLICFETFYGNQESALQQLYSGIHLINQCLEKQKRGQQLGVEDELYDVYSRLELYVMMLLQSRPSKLEKHARIKRIGPAISIPESFSSTDEANTALAVIQSHMMQLYHDNIDVAMPDEKPGFTIAPISLESTQLKKRDQYLDVLNSWYIAFDPIYQKVRGKEDDPEFIPAILLRLHYMTTYFTTASTLTGRTSRRREFMPMFNEIVSLARTIQQHPSIKNHHFTFHGQTIKPLYTVACRCPHRVLRRQAIALLLSFPRRESFWDATLCGKCSEWIMNFEEEDIGADGYVPDEARIVYFSVDPDLMKRTANVVCRRPQLATGKLIERRATISW